MPDRVGVDIYCEDHGHEQFARALLARISKELGVAPVVRTVSGRGGHGRARAELRGWQRAALSGAGFGQEVPDLLVVMIDANCSGWAQARRHIEEDVDSTLFARCVIGCPDPHVERWCLADPQGVFAVLGVSPPADPGKCERELYKRLLRETIQRSGQPILTTEMEFAPELVEAMDLYRAGKNHPSLKHFVEELRLALKSLG